MATGKVTIAKLQGLEGWLWDDRVIGFGARRQTNGVFFYLRYRQNGAQIMKSIGRHGSPWTPDTARNEAKRLLGTLAGGDDPFAQPLSAEGFGAEVERYLARKRPVLKPRSFEEVKQGESVLKGLLTERPLMTEKKGIDIIMTVNHTKVGMSSNSDWVVPASHDERRYAVSDVDNRYAKTVASEEVRKKYFGPIYKEIAEGGAAAMLYDLLKMPLGDWHPREVPMTTGLMRQKKQSLRGNFQWLEPLLQGGTLPTYCGRPNRILTADLLAYVKTFRGLEYATDESIASFLYDEMRFIPKLSPEGNKFRSKGVGRGWEFSPLLEMREHWETLYGGAWNWHDPDIDEWQRG